MAAKKSPPVNYSNQLHSLIIFVALLSLIIISAITLVQERSASVIPGPGTLIIENEESTE